MKMTVRALAWILAVAPVFACGDDEPTTIIDSPATGDGAVADTGTTPPVSDSSVPADAGAPSDAGPTGPRSDAGPTDAGSMDAALMADGGRDSSIPRQDSGTGSGSDSGSGPDGGGKDSGQAMAGPAFSDACLACEARSCTTTFYGDPTPFDLTKGCAMLTGNAEAGPGKGKPRSQLCQELVDCGRRTGCAHPSELGCLCGPLELSACQAKAEADGIANLPGACIREVRAAGEHADLDVRSLIDTYTAPPSGTYYAGLGTAIQLLQCGERVCTDACYAPCMGQPDQTVCDTFAQGDTFGMPERTCMAGRCPVLPDYYGELGLEPPPGM